MIPDWIPQEAWDAYITMRKTIKKPATEYAIKLVIGKLDGWRLEGYDVEAILNQSIEMSWQGVFPVKKIQETKKYESERDRQRREIIENLTGRDKYACKDIFENE